jgi:hypothetical protein
MNIEQNPVIALVVDRRTGKVVDCERFTYGPHLTDLVRRHDLLRYDIIIRAAASTQPVMLEEEKHDEDEFRSGEEHYEEPSAEGADASDDVPF